MCCILSGDPVEDPRGKRKTYNGPQKFQTDMCSAPCAGGCNTLAWCCSQMLCGCCTQCCLRRKVLNGDMSKYSCFQGMLHSCGIRAGSCGESSCPDLCLCLEVTCCNGLAVSASRYYVMEKYDLASDPCDYRLIRLNNFLQILSCICSIMAAIMPVLNGIAELVDFIADMVYLLVSGCMTAQVAHEVNYQNGKGNQMTDWYPGKVKPQPFNHVQVGSHQSYDYQQQQHQYPPPQYHQHQQQPQYYQQQQQGGVVYVQQQQQPAYYTQQQPVYIAGGQQPVYVMNQSTGGVQMVAMAQQQQPVYVSVPQQQQQIVYVANNKVVPM